MKAIRTCPSSATVSALVCFLIFLVLCLEQATAQSPFSNVRSEIDGLRDTDLWRENSTEVTPLWDRMGKSVSVLESYSKARLPEEYMINLNHQADALHRVRNREIPKPSRLEICKAVAEDLGVKETYALKKPTEPFSSVTVAANSKKDGQVTNGYSIRFVCEAWKDTPDRFERFPKESSPSEKRLPPGYYRMWTEKGNTTGTKTPVTVETVNGKSQTVDLDCPP